MSTDNTAADNKHSKAPGSFEQALRELLSFYDLRVDMEGILSTEALVPEANDILKATKILARVGFRADVSDIKSEPLNGLTYPSILVGAKGELAFCASADKAKEALGSDKYTGQIIYIKASPSESVLNLEHMKARHALDWFWAPIRNYWVRYSEVILASLMMNLLVLVIPIYTMNVYDRVVVHFVEETLIVLTLGVGLALLFDFFFKVIRVYLLERIAEDVGSKYDFDLMERLFRIKMTDKSVSIGELSNLFREMQSIRDFFASRLVPTIVDLPFIILFIVVIYFLAPNLAFVPLASATLIILLNLLVHIPMKLMTREYFSAIQNKASLLIETLAGLSTIKMFGAVNSRLLKWDVDAKRAARVNRHNNFMMALVMNLSMFISQFAHIMIVFVGVYEIQAGNMTIGGLIAASILSGRANGPVINLSSLLARLKQSNDVLKAIDNIYKMPHEGSEEMRKSPKGPFKGDVQLKSLTYQYETQNRPALKDINLIINDKDRIALIGKTAAGKTTLAKLVAGFLEPQEGNLMIDSYEYSSIPATELRRNIAFVPQEPFFFRGTILQNILLGRENISEEMIQQAIKVSGLDIVMQQTAKGLDTDVGELGAYLSGGQRQAISLARAIVSDPQILIFDEPTTGMDSALEQRVKAELNEYVKGRTFVMITHRTTLLSLVDRIVLMDSGSIIMDGSRDEVIAKLGGGGTS